MKHALKTAVMAFSMLGISLAPKMAKAQISQFYRQQQADTAFVPQKSQSPPADSSRKNKAILVIDLSDVDYPEDEKKANENIRTVIKNNPNLPVFVFAYDARQNLVDDARKMAGGNPDLLDMLGLSLDTSTMVAYRPVFSKNITEAAGPSAVKIIKVHKSAFEGTNLADTLHKMGIDTILVAGFHWLDCVKATVNDAKAGKFAVVTSPWLLCGHDLCQSDFDGAQEAAYHNSNREGIVFYQSNTVFLNSIEEINALLKK